MRNLFLKCVVFLAAIPLIGGLFSHVPQAAKGEIAKANGIEIWYEAFGQKENPALLLIMGAGCQGILWPTEFCERLASEGFYVVRYDHRDAGLSTCFDFEKDPYDLLDMSKDAIGLLDFLDVEKAHLLGLSMGGPIAELLSVHFPERILSIALAATSSNFDSTIRGFDGLPAIDGALSPPREDFLIWIKEFLKLQPQTETEKLEARLLEWRTLNGSAVPIEEERCRQIHTEFLQRLRHPSSIYNHLLAIRGSLDLIREVPIHVKVPAVIFHGSEDPIYPPDHGKALAAAIPHSKFVFIEGFGHVPNGRFYDLMIREIKQNAKQNEEVMKWVKQSEKKLIGIEIRTSNEEFQSQVPPLWHRFYRDFLHRIPGRVDGSILALYTDYEGDYTKPFSYIIGCEVAHLDEIPEGMVGKVIPAASYAEFTAKGPFPQSMAQTWQQIWKSPLNRSYTSDFEVYGSDFDPQSNPVVNIYIAADQ